METEGLAVSAHTLSKGQGASPVSEPHLRVDWHNHTAPKYQS